MLAGKCVRPVNDHRMDGRTAWPNHNHTFIGRSWVKSFWLSITFVCLCVRACISLWLLCRLYILVEQLRVYVFPPLAYRPANHFLILKFGRKQQQRGRTTEQQRQQWKKEREHSIWYFDSLLRFVAAIKMFITNASCLCSFEVFSPPIFAPFTFNFQMFAAFYIVVACF